MLAQLAQHLDPGNLLQLVLLGISSWTLKTVISYGNRLTVLEQQLKDWQER